MADPIVTPQELLIKLTEGREFDFFREAMLSVLRELMEVEISQKTGASLGERTSERVSVKAATSPASSNPAGAARRPSWPSSPKPT
jgi:hypothetical protein